MDDNINERGYMAFASSMLRQAVKDMRREGSPSWSESVEATAWLGSKKASLWFDAVGLEQEVALSKLNWIDDAQNILDKKESCLSDDQRRVIIDSLNYLVK